MKMNILCMESLFTIVMVLVDFDSLLRRLVLFRFQKECDADEYIAWDDHCPQHFHMDWSWPRLEQFPPEFNPNQHFDNDNQGKNPGLGSQSFTSGK
jgi:hypothetical protein